MTKFGKVIKASVFALATLIAVTAMAKPPEVLEEIWEVRLADVRMPANEADFVEVKNCVQCDKPTVSRTTEYRVGGFATAPVTLAQFRALIYREQNKEETIVYIGVDKVSRKVTRIVVSDGAR